MNWNNALASMKAGKVVRRANWSGNKFLYYVPSARYVAMTDVAKKIADSDGKVNYKEYIAIHTKEGSVGYYATTQCDVLADDWEEVAL